MLEEFFKVKLFKTFMDTIKNGFQGEKSETTPNN